MPNRLLIVFLFLVTLFLVRYFDFFYLYLPVREYNMGGKYEPTLNSFLIYNYLLKVLLLSAKFLTVAIILTAGIFLEGKTNKPAMVSFVDLIILAVLAEFVLFGSDLVKVIQFTVLNPSYDMEQYDNFFPFSLFSLLGTGGMTEFAYALQAINLFEVGYILVLIWGLKRLQYSERTKAESVVLFSYGSMLVVWILIMTYFTL